MPQEEVGPSLAYTLDETARLLGVSRATVNRIVRRGELRVARIGWRTVRVTPAAIEDFLRARETTGRKPTRGGGRRQGENSQAV